jgi:nitrogen fixation/metabolism regulation signal transduction histidine kinase
MNNNGKELIKCVTEPSDLHYLCKNFKQMTKTLQERRAKDATEKDSNRSNKNWCHHLLKQKHVQATKD